MNAFKHAAGKGQSVSLRVKADQLWLEVADQGQGFEVAEAANGNRLGLAGMRERVESLGGSFFLESMPGQGTLVRTRLALRSLEGDAG